MKSSPLTFLFSIWAVIACGVEAPREGERLPDFDRRLAAQQTAVAAPVAREQAARTLRERVGTVEIVSDSITQTPRWIGSTTQLLTGAVSRKTAAAFPANDRHGVVKAFLNEHRELFGHDATVLAGAKITREDRSPSGLRTARVPRSPRLPSWRKANRRAQ